MRWLARAKRAKARAVTNHSAMSFDDRNETAAPSKTGRSRNAVRRLSDRLRGPFDIKSVALTGLFVLAIFYTMYFMRAMLLPLVLALLLSYLLTPLVRGLNRIRIRPPLGAALVLLCLIGSVVYGISWLAEPAAAWIEKAPYSLQQLKLKLLPLKKPMEKVAQATGEIDKLTAPEPETTAKPQTVVVKRNAFAENFFSQTPEFIASAVVMLILLYFLLASDGVFLGKIIKLNEALEDKKRALSIMREIEAQISRYLLTVTPSTSALAQRLESRFISSGCAIRSCGA